MTFVNVDLTQAYVRIKQITLNLHAVRTQKCPPFNIQPFY